MRSIDRFQKQSCSPLSIRERRKREEREEREPWKQGNRYSPRSASSLALFPMPSAGQSQISAPMSSWRQPRRAGERGARGGGKRKEAEKQQTSPSKRLLGLSVSLNTRASPCAAHTQTHARTQTHTCTHSTYTHRRFACLFFSLTLSLSLSFPFSISLSRSLLSPPALLCAEAMLEAHPSASAIASERRKERVEKDQQRTSGRRH